MREGAFEGQCEVCRIYLPLDAEFWFPKSGLRRCRACWRLYFAAKERGRKVAHRELINAANRERYRLMPIEQKARHNEATRRWKAANRDHVAAYNAAYRSRKAA